MNFPTDLVRETAIRILEEAAFVFAETAPEADGTALDLAVAIEFAGPGKGRIVLASTRDFAADLAANMLGTEPGDPAALADAEAALAELLNIFAGSLVCELFGSATVCHLGIPSLVPAAELAAAPLCIALITDDERPLEFRLEPLEA